MSKNIVHTSFADFSLLEDKIILIKFIFDGELLVENAVEILKITAELSQNRGHSIIYDFNNHNVIFCSEIKKMAQNRNETDNNLVSRAFVTYSVSNKLECNHFVKFNKPSSPTQLFNSLAGAIAWVKSIAPE